MSLLFAILLLFTCSRYSTAWVAGGCGEVPDIAHGSIADGQSTIGSIRTISCANGYQIHGSEVVRCDDDGHWKVDGHCNEVGHCGHIPFIENGMITEGPSTIGAIRAFTCYNGFIVNGSSLMQCTPSRRWRIEGNCVADSCQSSPILENGRVFAGESKIGSTRRVTCAHGYGLTGSDTITCAPDRTWKIETNCIPVKFVKELLDSAARGDVATLKLLIQQGADVNGKDGDGMTALHKAAQNGHGAAATTLLEHGAYANARNRLEQTALILSSELGHVDIVQALLERGAEIDARDEDGDSALIVATWDGHTAVVKRLLDFGAEVNFRNQDGKTALGYASESPNLADIAQLLRSKGGMV